MRYEELKAKIAEAGAWGDEAEEESAWTELWQAIEQAMAPLGLTERYNQAMVALEAVSTRADGLLGLRLSEAQRKHLQQVLRLRNETSDCLEQAWALAINTGGAETVQMDVENFLDAALGAAEAAKIQADSASLS